MGLKQTQVQVVKNKIRELDFFPKKFLGQHFLINHQVIKKTVSMVEALNPALVMEVGPGLGALTDEFIVLKLPLCVVEKDSVLCQYWRQKGICVLEGDVLKLPWQDQLLSNSILAGNLPYQVASRLMIRCCPGPDQLKAMVLMFQKEVAQRILASPRSRGYGLLSVMSQCFWEVSVIMEAAVSDFYPRPQVAGRILVFRRKEHSLTNAEAFLSFVKLCFSQRRKFLLNKFKKKVGGDNVVADIFNQMNLSFSIRAEELSPRQFMSLFSKVISKKQL